MDPKDKDVNINLCELKDRNPTHWWRVKSWRRAYNMMIGYGGKSVFYEKMLKERRAKILNDLDA